MKSKPVCPNCKRNDRVYVLDKSLRPSKKSGERVRWICRRKQLGCRSWSVPANEDYAKLAPIRALNPKIKKAIAMWVSLIHPEEINDWVGIKYKTFQKRVVHVFKEGLWDKMVESINSDYQLLVPKKRFNILKADCKDFVKNKKGFRRMVLARQRYWKTKEDVHQMAEACLAIDQAVNTDDEN